MADFFYGILGACELLSKLISSSAKSIIDLRIFAIVSNIFGGILHVLTGAWPQLTQNVFEIPIHLWRLKKTRRAMYEIDRAENPDYAIAIIRKLALQRTIAKDQIIFKKGDVAQAAYVIQSGSVMVVEPNVLISDGALFGEMGLFLDDKARTATTVATQDVILHEIAYDTFEKIYARNPEIGFAVMRLMSRRFGPSSTSRDGDGA